MQTDPTIPRVGPVPAPVLRSGRNPLAISVLLVFLLSGTVGLLTPEASSPILAEVLGHWVWVWHTGLVIGSSTALLGLALRPLSNVLVERVGMMWMASLFLAYFVAVCVTDDAYFTTYSGVILSLGIAFAARVVQITRDLRRLHQVLKELPGRQEA